MVLFMVDIIVVSGEINNFVDGLSALTLLGRAAAAAREVFRSMNFGAWQQHRPEMMLPDAGGV